jgi:hypothetical protein
MVLVAAGIVLGWAALVVPGVRGGRIWWAAVGLVGPGVLVSYL